MNVMHQNLKMIDATDEEKLTIDSQTVLKVWNDCIKCILCKNPEPSCSFLECKSCPGIKKFCNAVSTMLEKEDVS